MDLIFLNQNEIKTYAVKVAVYKLVKKTQNQIRAQLIVQNLFVCFYCVFFFVYLLIFPDKNYEFVHVVLSYAVS